MVCILVITLWRTLDKGPDQSEQKGNQEKEEVAQEVAGREDCRLGV